MLSVILQQKAACMAYLAFADSQMGMHAVHFNGVFACIQYPSWDHDLYLPNLSQLF